MRERRPGVWEIRVVVANDEVTGRSRAALVTFTATPTSPRRAVPSWSSRFGVDRRALFCTGARLDLAELLERFLAGNGHWRPAPRSSNTSAARFLTTDPLGSTGLAAITPAVIEAAFSPWRRQVASAALVWGRWAVLRSALSWAVTQRFLRANPLDTMRAPPRPLPRKHLLPSEVAILLRTADDQVTAAEQRPTGGHALERCSSPTRPAYSFASRPTPAPGEVSWRPSASSDLPGRVLTIERNLSLDRRRR